MLPAIALLIAALGAWAYFCWGGLYSLHLRWIRLDEGYAAGYPAVALALWWLWRHRQLCERSIAAPAWSAAIVFGGMLLLCAIGQLVQLQILQQLGAFGALWSGGAMVFGWRVARVLIFPFALVALGIPLWDFLVDPLRAMTVWFNQHVLAWLEIPALIDGFFIVLPAGTLEVAGGCSGLSLLLAMTLVGLLFAESHVLPLRRRVAIVLLAIAVGILDNWIRVLVLVLLAHFSQMQSELLHNHGNLGWWIFATNLLPYFWLAAKIEHWRGAASVVQGAGDYVALDARQLRNLQAAALAAIVAIGATSAAVAALDHRRGSAAAGFAGPAAAVAVQPSWLPQYRGYDVAQAWRTKLGGRDAELVALTYIEQRADKKLIYYSNVIAGEYALRPLDRVSIAPDFEVNVSVVHDTASRIVWWYWWVDGATATSPLATKLLQLRAMLAGDPSAALIALSLPCNRSECAEVAARMMPAATALLIEARRMHAAAQQAN